MGRKIVPLYTSEQGEDAEFERFKELIEDIDIERAISICRISKDSKGHNSPLSFRMPDISLRIISEIKSKEKRFKCDSDILRTAYLIGIKVLLNHLKEGKIIGDTLDDSLFALENAIENMKIEEMYETLRVTLKEKLKTMGQIYKNRKPLFINKIRELEKGFLAIKNKDWRNYLLNEFNREVNKIKEEIWPEDV